MRKVVFIAVWACLAVVSPAGNAETNDETVGKMRGFCGKPDGDFFKTYCYTYIGGFVDGAIMAGGSTPVLCLPDGVTNKQLALVFSKWADANPEIHHLPSTAGIMLATSAAFPCQKR